MHRMKLRVNADQTSSSSATCEWDPEADWQQNFHVQPARRPGRPLMRWDDRLRSFCKRHFPNVPCWTQVAACTDWKHKALEFVSEFLTL